MTPKEAYEAFMTPGRPPARARREQELLERGEQLNLTARDHQVVGHRWGTGPKVLVQHGWGSRATAMWAIIKALEQAGFEVYAFDAPGNGDSEGDRSSMFHFVATMLEASRLFGPFRGVVTHSIASAGLPYALTEGLETERVVLLSPRDDLDKFLTRFFELAEFDEAMIEQTRQHWAEEFGWDNLMGVTPSVLAPGLQTPALIIHDRQDEDVPFPDGIKIHESWPDSQLVLTDGLGHVRIVRSQEVADQIVAFLQKD